MDLFSSFQISQFLLKLVVCPTGDPVHLLYHKFTGGAVVVQLLSHVRLFATPWTAACQLPCPSLSPAVCSDSCPLSQWYYLTIPSSATPFPFCLQSFSESGSFPMSQFFASSGQNIGVSASASVIPFSSGLQSFPTSGSFQMSQLFRSSGQNIGVSASTSVLPMNTQDWLPLGWTGWISFAVQGTLKSLLQHHSSKASILWCSALFIVQLSHPYMTTGKTIAFDYIDLCWQSNVFAFQYAV